MSDSNNNKPDFLRIKIVQSGEIERIPLTERNQPKKFKEILNDILKDLKLKQKDVFISNDLGQGITGLNLSLTIKEIVEKFGSNLKFYSDKIL